MARNPPNPELIKLVVKAAKSGASADDIATQVGVARTTVQRWLKKYGGGVGLRTETTPEARSYARRLARAERAEATEAPLPEPTEAPPTTDGAVKSAITDALAEAQSALATIKSIVAEAKAVGNYTAAQRAARDLSGIVNTIARIQRTLGGDGEIRLSKAEIDEAREQYRARMAAVLAAPLTCSHCGRELRVEWATK